MSQMKNLFYLLSKSVVDVLPLIAVILLFSQFVIDEPIGNFYRISIGFVMVIIGLFIFMRGLNMGIFPLGASMAYSFAERGNLFWLLLFAALLGYSSTIAEPALIAVCNQAEQSSNGELNGFILRNAVAIGVAAGLVIGTLRIILGHPIQIYIAVGYIIVMIITIFSPVEIVGVAYDSGGVATSVITVPLIAALGIGLANSIEGRNPIVDGFGLIAFAALAPMVTVMLYGIFLYNF